MLPAMDYESLSQNETDHLSVEDTEKDRGYAFYSRSSRKRLSISIFTLIGLSSITLISVLLLLFSVWREHRLCGWQGSSWNVSMTYPEQHISQMGLSHEHDHMWNVFDPDTHFGLIYKEHPDTAGMISM